MVLLERRPRPFPGEGAPGGSWAGSSFLAGFLGGQALLVVGLLQGGADVFNASPSVGHALAVALRSVATYGLGGGLLALVPGLLIVLLGRGLGRRPRVFAAVASLYATLLALVSLTSWWQIRVLVGLPLSSPGRWRAGLVHLSLSLLVGVVAFALLSRGPRRGPPRVLVPALLVASLLLFAATTPTLSSRAPATRDDWTPRQTVIVGLDGLTFRVLAPMIRSGELPAFRRLVDEGAWGTLLTYGVTASPVVWTSIATGKRARDHGIEDFVENERSNYGARPVRSTDRKVSALWNLLSRNERKVAVINWMVTSPPEAVHGVVISKVVHEKELQTHPPELGPEILELLGRELDPSTPELLQPMDKVFTTAHEILDRERPDFVALYDRTSDNVSHTTWKAYEPEAFDAAAWDLDAAEIAAHAEDIPEVYRALDRHLGELIDRLDEDALLIVVSDHGSRAAKSPRVFLRLDRLLAQLGFAEIDDEGRLISGRSRAYTWVESSFARRARVNINRRGREKHGLVAEDEAADLLADLAEALRDVRFVSGAPLFSRVREGSSVGADLAVSYSRHTLAPASARDSLVVGGVAVPYSDFLHVQTRISGGHERQGVIFVHGRGIRPGPIGQNVVPTPLHEILWHLTDRVLALDPWFPALGRLGLLDRATTLDITPTVLYANGLALGRDMAGRPLTELFAGREPPRWLPTLEPASEPEKTSPEDAPASREAGPDEEALERLRSLGYLD